MVTTVKSEHSIRLAPSDTHKQGIQVGVQAIAENPVAGNNVSYKVSEQPLGTIKPVRIITIGAGASGINMAYQAMRHLKNVEHIVYEKNEDVGGTWFENRYPGCKCDIRKFARHSCGGDR